MLGQPISMLLPEVVGIPHARQIARRRHRHRSGADRDPDAAQEGRGRPLRRILRAGHRRAGARRPRHHRQHGAGIRRHLRLLPDRRRDHALSDPHRPRCRSGSSWSRPMPRRRGCGTTPNRPIRSSPTRSISISRIVEPSLAGPRRPQDRVALSAAASSLRGRAAEARRKPRQSQDRRSGQGRGRQLFGKGRRRGDRRHHVLHQHLQSERDARRRPLGAQRVEARPQGQALGQDLARAGQPGGDGLLRRLGPAEGPRRAGLQPGGLWLHHLHRQFRAAAARLSPRRWTRAIWWSAAVLSGNRNFEGRIQPAGAGELSGVAALGRGLRAGRLGRDRHHHRPARPGR